MSDKHDAPDAARYSAGDWLCLLGLIAFAILVPTLIVKIHLLGESSPFSWSTRTVGGLLAASLAFAIDAFNLYLGFIRSWLHQRRFGTMDGYQHASGAPILGSIFVFYAAMALPAHPVAAVPLLLLYILDPWGIHVAAFAMIRNLISDNASSGTEPESDNRRDQ